MSKFKIATETLTRTPAASRCAARAFAAPAAIAVALVWSALLALPDPAAAQQGTKTSPAATSADGKGTGKGTGKSTGKNLGNDSCDKQVRQRYPSGTLGNNERIQYVFACRAGKAW